MNGPDHYREAEQLLNSCQLPGFGPGGAEQYPAHEDGVNSIGNALAAAQVHATLAVAAAHAHNITDATDKQIADWQNAIGGGE